MTRDEAANIITDTIADHDEGLAAAIDAHWLVDQIMSVHAQTVAEELARLKGRDPHGPQSHGDEGGLPIWRQYEDDADRIVAALLGRST